MEFSKLCKEIKEYHHLVHTDIQNLLKNFTWVNLTNLNSTKLGDKINELEKLIKSKEEIYTALDNILNNVLTNISNQTKIEKSDNISTPIKVVNDDDESNMEVHPLEVAMYFNETPQCECKKMYTVHEDSFAIEALEGKKHPFCGKDTGSLIFDVMNCDNFTNFLKNSPALAQLFNNRMSDTLYGDSGYEKQIENISNIEDIQKLFTPKAVVVAYYNKSEVINILRIFIELSCSTRGTYNKSWICLSMYDFIVKNWKFCKEHPKFRCTVTDKWVNELINTPEYVSLGRKINPYFDQYTEFFKDIMEYDKMTLLLPKNGVDICLKELSSKIDNFIVSKL
jgi:hypothetical protein